MEQGAGKLSFSNGDIYEGQFYQGSIHGKGVYSWKSGL